MTTSPTPPEDQPDRCPLCGADLTTEPSPASGDTACLHCGRSQWFTWEDLGDVKVVWLTGNLLGSEPMERLTDLLTPVPSLRLVLDFGSVQHPSSRFLSKLIDLQKKVRLAGGKLRLRNLDPSQREIFRICRLDQVLEIEE